MTELESMIEVLKAISAVKENTLTAKVIIDFEQGKVIRCFIERDFTEEVKRQKAMTEFTNCG